MDIVLLLGGLLAVIAGAELVVRHGAGLAERYGIPPMLVGMTVVALATSTPELAVGISAARQGTAELAIGNIIGTNLVNVLLVLGISAALRAILFEKRTLRVDLPIMTGASLVLFLLAIDGQLSTVDGLVLTAIGLAYLGLIIVYGVRLSRAAAKRAAAEQAPPAGSNVVGADEDGSSPSAPSSAEAAPSSAKTAPSPASAASASNPAGAASAPNPAGATRSRGVLSMIGLLLLGLAVVVLGSELLVDGSVGVAASLGISEAVIGLTVIAIGTSAPELVTTIVSTVRNERDLAIGNLLGSSVFNIALVLGPTVLLAPGSVPVPESIIRSDLVLMVIVALVCLPTFWSHRRLGRVEGALFVTAYVAYLAWMIVGTR